MDPIFIYVMAIIFVGGPLIALWHIRWRHQVKKWVGDWVDRLLDRRTP